MERRYGLFVVIVLIFLIGGCKSGSSSNSVTGPQSDMDVTGTWNITSTVKTNTCGVGGEPGTSGINMTLTLVQEGSQVTSPEYPGSSGTIDTSTGEFSLTYGTLFTLEGVTDGTTASGTYTYRPGTCEIVYDFTGTKISTNTKQP
jgi:hypothetical protein